MFPTGMEPTGMILHNTNNLINNGFIPLTNRSFDMQKLILIKQYSVFSNSPPLALFPLLPHSSLILNKENVQNIRNQKIWEKIEWNYLIFLLVILIAIADENYKSTLRSM